MADRQGPLRVLVLGGSQGARALNLAMPIAMRESGVALDVRHQCGQRLQEAARSAYTDGGQSVRLEAFIDDMAEAYAWADLVIARAGALTLAEIAAVGIGAVLVPFPHAVDDHQTANARVFVDAGAARLLPESSQLAGKLAECLRELAGDPAQRLEMAQAARRLAWPDAAERVAEIVLQEARA
jgi:UDP-N-acetylglucosamine--N-acetylmuramyl-(pentapeptide) pyrophosphoryl-undecaprenol N-acetylglucosamine transferase